MVHYAPPPTHTHTHTPPCMSPLASCAYTHSWLDFQVNIMLLIPSLLFPSSPPLPLPLPLSPFLSLLPYPLPLSHVFPLLAILVESLSFTPTTVSLFCLDTLQTEVLIHVTHTEGPALLLSLDQVTNVPLCCIPQYNREIVIVLIYMCATVLHGTKIEKFISLLHVHQECIRKGGIYLYCSVSIHCINM